MQTLLQKLAQAWLQQAITIVHERNPPIPPKWKTLVGKVDPEHGSGWITCTNEAIQPENPHDCFAGQSFNLSWTLEEMVVPGGEDRPFEDRNIDPGTGMAIILRLDPNSSPYYIEILPCVVGGGPPFPLRAAHELDHFLSTVVIRVADA